jgi:hypothetical protein
MIVPTAISSTGVLSAMAWLQQLLFARQFDCRVRLSDRVKMSPVREQTHPT